MSTRRDLAQIFVALSLISFLPPVKGGWADSFTVLNNCGYTVWPGFLWNAGIAPTGFEQTPTGWSGRVWGRTTCIFGTDAKDNRTTSGDCKDGTIIPPAARAEFTFDPVDLDFGLVDGRTMLLVANGGTGSIAEINFSCPKELQLDDGLYAGNDNVLACKSACEAFGCPSYCSIEACADPNMCEPSAYTQLSKPTCPLADSYTFDDKTSTFLSADADHAVMFCPTAVIASEMSSISTPLATSPVVSAGTSNSNGPGRTIFGDSGIGKKKEGNYFNVQDSTATPSWTSILYMLLPLISTLLLLY